MPTNNILTKNCAFQNVWICKLANLHNNYQRQVLFSMECLVLLVAMPNQKRNKL